MFTSKNDLTPMSVASAAQPSAPHRPVPNRIILSGSVPSIISADIVLQGMLSSTGEIQIDGRIDGDVRCVKLVIGGTGKIFGDIFAGEVTIRGEVRGRIRANNVWLGASSRVEGDILQGSLAVEAGAFFEGDCRHSDDPLAET